MVAYRRSRVSGGTFFFTVNLRDRRAHTLVDHIDLLRSAIRMAKTRRPFTIEAIAVLPEHLHTLWTLPPGDRDYPGRWRAIKGAFTQSLLKSGVAVRYNGRGEGNVWQQRYWEHTIRDTADLARHVDYIHFNPVKHGWAKRVGDWPHSTFHGFVDRGLYPADWGGGNVPDDRGAFGEHTS